MARGHSPPPGYDTTRDDTYGMYEDDYGDEHLLDNEWETSQSQSSELQQQELEEALNQSQVIYRIHFFYG